MDRTKLKNYAPQARREFIQAMVDRAAYYGLTADKAEPVVEKGDVAVIGGRSFPIATARKRQALEDRIKRHGFQQTMEAMAYTWFNRLVAIRYMELHGYLDHGYRVLSHPEGKPTPEILEHAEHVDFPGLKKDRVIDLKLAGNKEGELYRLLLTSQCNALHSAMPFLFERIDDETELLLPDNLLNSDSLIRKLVNEIDEADWQEVEIIGWLYQFYISERKDEVIGKVVASEDIPAATQLFTPNWIVKYLVQNTLGRQWLATYPQSALRQQMEYYIEPAEQTPEVQEQLNAITPTSLNPEELTLLDPACGSGHILVEAYDLFKAIYLERGYRAKDIPALILQKNLFGLEIDDRAAQLAAFALMMKARADDRRIFESEAKPIVVAIQESEGGQKQADEIAFALSADPGSELYSAICELHALFENAKTFGSLIQIPKKLAEKLQEIEKRLDDVLVHGDLIHASANILEPFLLQSRLLSRRYDAVVANPPYMGVKGMNESFKMFAKKHYSDSRTDAFAMFIVRSFLFMDSHIAFVTPFVWMFLSSYEELRRLLLKSTSLTSLIQLEYNAFEPACVPVCSFVASRKLSNDYKAKFIKLSEFKGHENQAPRTREAIENPKCGWAFSASTTNFHKLPGYPIAFWANSDVYDLFEKFPPLSDSVTTAIGLFTCDNARFVRQWWEVNNLKIEPDPTIESFSMGTTRKWVRLNKGGGYRRWFGANTSVVDFKDSAAEIRKHRESSGQSKALPGEKFYFREGINWSMISSIDASFRYFNSSFAFDMSSPSMFTQNPNTYLSFLNSKITTYLLNLLNPTLNLSTGTLDLVPDLSSLVTSSEHVADLIHLVKADWDSQELSWDYHSNSLVISGLPTVFESFKQLEQSYSQSVKCYIECEEQNNLVFVSALGLDGQFDPSPTPEQITLTKPNLAEDIRRLLSYAIGCMMGRYSLDKPGLIYAHSGNQGFDPSQYISFRADDDGIIPIIETDWGIRDDATNRFVEFIGVAWPKEHLEENLKFVAESLGATGSEPPRDTIRRYLATGFYKHHLSMYKKRPIYWLFSSGKLRSFQCLVYLHRYNEGTLARMRTEYVIPLQGQITARIDQLEGDKAKATSTSHRTKIQKEQDKLKKQQAELATFEEKLKHYADMRISLDLDDGVKVNYARFGDLLAESKAITGGKDDE